MRRRDDRCERVRTHLPGLVADDLPGWRRRLVERHLRRCDDCREEADRQHLVAAGLVDLGHVVDEELARVAPPEDLLATLLAQAHDPGLRARAAVPARGAVSGARPGLSVALALVLLASAAVAAWAGWRLGRRLAGAADG